MEGVKQNAGKFGEIYGGSLMAIFKIGLGTLAGFLVGIALTLFTSRQLSACSRGECDAAIRERNAVEERRREWRERQMDIIQRGNQMDATDNDDLLGDAIRLIMDAD